MSEVKVPTTGLNDEPLIHSPNHLKSNLKKYRFIYSLLIVLALTAGIFLVVKIKNTAPTNAGIVSPLPTAVLKNTSFPLYYPQNLPLNHTYDEKQFVSNSEVVVYVIKYSGGRELVFTQQPLPKKATVEGLTEQLESPSLVNMADGEAVIGKYGKDTLSVITTEKTMILIRAKSTVDNEDLKAIIKSLRKV